MFYYLMLMVSMIMFILSMYMASQSTFIVMDLTILSLHSFNIPFSLMLDWYSLLFSATVMIISSAIMIFSLTYIPNKEFKQFSYIMMAFVLSMLILILSDNIMLILLGWDGLGLSSFILVIYYQNFSSSASGSITILSNRLGDIAILISMSILTMKLYWNFIHNEEFPKLVMILLMIAAISKSAQFPFSSWLPAAMAAPTPISALVHSSTLVTAGVYLLIRVMNYSHPNSMIILMLISSATTIYASMTANWEQDMKKIIALSTLSQIGMMMFAISMGSFKIAFFHLIIHAMFKSMMFLCAGMMIHNYSYQDTRNMNLMKKASPMMLLIMIISNMTLMGVPFMSGFFSKDSIIEFMSNSKMYSLLMTVMIISIGMTASYSMRMIKLAMKIVLKHKPDTQFSNNTKMEMPMLMMVPFSIFMGAIMLWVMIPTQIFFTPYSFKIIILLSMLTGLLLGINVNFKSKNFMNLGNYSISLWFLNFLSTQFTIFTTPTMNLMQKNDKSWQEMYGPQNYYTFMKTNFMNPEMNLNLPTFLFMLLLLSPLFIMMIM